MATLPKSNKITYEEWLRMPTTNSREEVVDGVIQTMPPNKLPHPIVIDNLTRAFHRQLDRATSRFFSSVFGLVISRQPLVCREPDVAIFERSSIVEEDGYIQSAPQLLIEVLSPSESRREIESKLRDYESIGTPEVWLISPEAATVEVLLLQDGKLRRSALLAEGQLKPKHFPSVSIDISEIWPD